MAGSQFAVRVVLVSVLLGLPSVGCSPPADAGLAYRFIVSPAPLFDGALSRLEPHIDLSSFGVLIECQRGEALATLVTEVWHEGKVSGTVEYSVGPVGEMLDVSVSARYGGGQDGLSFVWAAHGRERSWRSTLPLRLPSTTETKLEATTVVTESDEIVVLGLYSEIRGGGEAGVEPEKLARNSDRAVLFKVKLARKPA